MKDVDVQSTDDLGTFMHGGITLDQNLDYEHGYREEETSSSVKKMVMVGQRADSGEGTARNLQYDSGPTSNYTTASKFTRGLKMFNETSKNHSLKELSPLARSQSKGSLENIRVKVNLSQNNEDSRKDFE